MQRLGSGWYGRGAAQALSRIGQGAAAALLLAGCATVDFDLGGRELAALTPAAALSGDDAGALVVWGGRIVATRNRADSTELTVLSYPMTPGHRPRSEAEPGARFIAIHPGFLEPERFAPGRWVSLLGTVGETVTIRVGERELAGPTLRMEQAHLWEGVPGRGDTRVSFGFGFGIDV